MRSLLSVTGIVIGITSVISIIGLSNSAKILISTKITTYGENAAEFLMEDNPWLSQNDINKIRASVPHIKYITPVINSQGECSYMQKKIRKVKLYGVENDFFIMKEWEIENGRKFNANEIFQKRNVAIIGNNLVEEFFPGQNPINKTIRYNNRLFTVIGTVKSLGKGFTNVNYDNIIIIPVTTCSKLFFDSSNYQRLYVSVTDELYESTMVNTIRDYFRNKFNLLPNEKETFLIQTTREKVFLAKIISKLLTYLMVVVASISLFVGGIGIMNIMLASVNERIREIGIRMAIGAKKHDIIVQFLLESVILCSIGGIIGITFGLSLYYLIVIIADWPFILSIISIIVSTLFSALVGMIFGIFPALKASDLKPVEALAND
ncbi:MAG: ABC transporter permease [Spirochaetes bacterium]|nr:ABC transporter permease [Spirochaetota bacterium]